MNVSTYVHNVTKGVENSINWTKLTVKNRSRRIIKGDERQSVDVFRKTISNYYRYAKYCDLANCTKAIQRTSVRRFEATLRVRETYTNSKRSKRSHYRLSSTNVAKIRANRRWWRRGGDRWQRTRLDSRQSALCVFRWRHCRNVANSSTVSLFHLFYIISAFLFNFFW